MMNKKGKGHSQSNPTYLYAALSDFWEGNRTEQSRELDGWIEKGRVSMVFGLGKIACKASVGYIDRHQCIKRFKAEEVS